MAVLPFAVLTTSDYSYQGETGTGQVALGTDFPSKILRLNVPEYGGKLVCQKGALLCASHTVDIAMEFSKNFSTGFFGGEGFVLQVGMVSGCGIIILSKSYGDCRDGNSSCRL